MRMTRKCCYTATDEDPPEGAELLKPKRLVQAQRALQKTLDMMERTEVFLDDPDALVCKWCGMPCFDDEVHNRRAYPATGDTGTVICGDCLLS
jgi:hypothetical protein